MTCTSGEYINKYASARATSAAPGYFKPFIKGPDELTDGGILHNNPIEIAMEEVRRLASAENLAMKPDIVLSLGTGLPKKGSMVEDSDITVRSLGALRGSLPGLLTARAQAKFSLLRMAFTMVKNQVRLNLDCERRWDYFCNEFAGDPDWRARMHRLNPDLLTEPPVMDKVGEVDSLYDKAKNWVALGKTKDHISNIACILIASSFYFERSDHVSRGQNSYYQLHGLIRCRLSDDANDVKALGRLLGSCVKPAAFVVKIPGSNDEEYAVPVQEMIDSGHFEGVELEVTVQGEETITTIDLRLEGLARSCLFHLSGFPRMLLKEAFNNSSL